MKIHLAGIQLQCLLRQKAISFGMIL